MNAVLLSLAFVLAAATAPSRWIEVTSTTADNLSVTVELVGKQMRADLCCTAARQFALAIGEGTCAAPATGGSAIVVGHNDWRAGNGKLSAKVPTIFPIRSSKQFHLFVFDFVTSRPTDMLACGDVPADLITP